MAARDSDNGWTITLVAAIITAAATIIAAIITLGGGGYSSGRLVAWTLFIDSHSYAAGGFSTQTGILSPTRGGNCPYSTSPPCAGACSMTTTPAPPQPPTSRGT